MKKILALTVSGLLLLTALTYFMISDPEKAANKRPDIEIHFLAFTNESAHYASGIFVLSNKSDRCVFRTHSYGYWVPAKFGGNDYRSGYFDPPGKPVAPGQSEIFCAFFPFEPRTWKASFLIEATEGYAAIAARRIRQMTFMCGIRAQPPRLAEWRVETEWFTNQVIGLNRGVKALQQP